MYYDQAEISSFRRHQTWSVKVQQTAEMDWWDSLRGCVI